jgi:hypothetical protein
MNPSLQLKRYIGLWDAGVATKMITGADNGSTQFSSDRCDQESVFMKWLFAQKRIAN